MNDIIHGCYLEAGKIASKVRKEAQFRVKEDIPLLEVAEYVENRIEALGAKPAFPCNISINEIASHYTPEDYVPRFKKGDVVKIDIGAHIDGYIADTAVTLEIGTKNHARLILACDEALEKAIASIKDRAQTGAVGKIIEETIKKHGFNPVKDLTGHSLERYKLHAGVTIPNYKSFFSNKIKKDMVFAIEPFATYGKGNIKHGKPHIFALSGRVEGKERGEIRKRFGTLPFTLRWIPEINGKDRRGLREYFELIEAGGEIVAQSEHTVIANEEGCEVITR
ncbi:MAG: type II methionyl aminopeptidase [Candidatus Methanoperedens sp.]|nr:type II methionyl aminopeptidase [Candidatus Methanoperedens sp.]MCZ7395679.1 type II methionyl aminopeptidase [Candidatus Methanoperedens sp.]